MATTRSDDDWYSDKNATFGDRVAGAREAAGLSQEDLARRLGVRRKTVREWEDDVTEPRANKLQMLAGLLNVSIRWLLTGDGDGLAGPADLSDGGSPEFRELLTELREVSGQLRVAAERVAVIEKRLRIAAEADTP